MTSETTQSGRTMLMADEEAAARAEKSVDKARGETREQTFPEGDVFLFHKKYLRSPVWAAEAVFMRVLIICG